MIRTCSPAGPYSITLTDVCQRNVRGAGHCPLAGRHALVLCLITKVDGEDYALVVADDDLLGSGIDGFDFADYTADR